MEALAIHSEHAVVGHIHDVELPIWAHGDATHSLGPEARVQTASVLAVQSVRVDPARCVVRDVQDTVGSKETTRRRQVFGSSDATSYVLGCSTGAVHETRNQATRAHVSL